MIGLTATTFTLLCLCTIEAFALRNLEGTVFGCLACAGLAALLMYSGHVYNTNPRDTPL